MFSANQIAGFFNQPYKQPDFLHVNTSSHKLKLDQIFSGWTCRKWAWLVWSRDPEIDCISRMNGWNEMIFFTLVQILES